MTARQNHKRRDFLVIAVEDSRATIHGFGAIGGVGDFTALLNVPARG